MNLENSRVSANVEDRRAEFSANIFDPLRGDFIDAHRLLVDEAFLENNVSRGCPDNANKRELFIEARQLKANLNNRRKTVVTIPTASEFAANLDSDRALARVDSCRQSFSSLQDELSGRLVRLNRGKSIIDQSLLEEDREKILRVRNLLSSVYSSCNDLRAKQAIVSYFRYLARLAETHEQIASYVSSRIDFITGMQARLNASGLNADRCTTMDWILGRRPANRR